MRPLARYLEQFSACSPQTVTRCHSVRSWRWPPLSLKTSLVAMLRLHTGRLLGVYFSSGSAPRFPTKITLFTLPIVRVPPLRPHHAKSALKKRPQVFGRRQSSARAAREFPRSVRTSYSFAPDARLPPPPCPPVVGRHARRRARAGPPRLRRRRLPRGRARPRWPRGAPAPHRRLCRLPFGGGPVLRRRAGPGPGQLRGARQAARLAPGAGGPLARRRLPVGRGQAQRG